MKDKNSINMVFKINFYKTIEFFISLIILVTTISCITTVAKSYTVEDFGKMGTVLIPGLLFLCLLQYLLWRRGQLKIVIEENKLRHNLPWKECTIPWDKISKLQRVWAIFAGNKYLIHYEGGCVWFPDNIRSLNELVSIIEDRTGKKFTAFP